MVVAVWLALVGRTLAGAASNLAAGRDAADQLRGLNLDDAVSGPAAKDLGKALVRFDDSRRQLADPLLAPLRFVPVVGRQLRSASSLGLAAARASQVGLTALQQGDHLLTESHGTGPERVSLLRGLAGLAQATGRRLTGLNLGPRAGLVPPLARARNELASRIVRTVAELTRVHAASRASALLLAGPSRYLVFGANNAEMRAGAGMLLSVGILQAGDGRLRLSGFRSVTSVPVPHGAVPLSGDLAARWGWLQPNTDWRNLLLSPRFDVAAPLAARMWKASGGGAVDGVLVLDPVALQSILAATGPIEVDHQSIGADQVVDQLLHEQYVEFPDLSQRREELGRVAAGAISALSHRPWSVQLLADGLAKAAIARHLLVWSSQADEERDWATAGVDGAMSPDSLLLAVINRGANKLDPFLQVRATLRVAPAPAATHCSLTVTLTNRVDSKEPAYVAGPDDRVGLPKGYYLGILSVSLPGVARQGEIDGLSRLVVAGPDGPTRVIGTEVILPPGSSRTLVVRFLLPTKHGSLRLEPSARVPQVDWLVDGRHRGDSLPTTISW